MKKSEFITELCKMPLHPHWASYAATVAEEAGIAWEPEEEPQDGAPPKPIDHQDSTVTMPRVKFKPETCYFINPTPDIRGTLGLSIYFGKTVDGVPSVGLKPRGGPEGSSWVMSKEAALLLSLLIQVHFGAEQEGDFSLAT